MRNRTLLRKARGVQLSSWLEAPSRIPSSPRTLIDPYGFIRLNGRGGGLPARSPFDPPRTRLEPPSPGDRQAKPRRRGAPSAPPSPSPSPRPRRSTPLVPTHSHSLPPREGSNGRCAWTGNQTIQSPWRKVLGVVVWPSLRKGGGILWAGLGGGGFGTVPPIFFDWILDRTKRPPSVCSSQPGSSPDTGGGGFGLYHLFSTIPTARFAPPPEVSPEPEQAILANLGSSLLFILMT